ncbi:hypothetical protein [Halosimplex salinum]|uniref:hypothetical protein n=1 Tax=Halosimplex salinum TaxID=1710538 RepID=UPI000F46A946|nr:hypothetical protein [Halosimplex salinum]
MVVLWRLVAGSIAVVLGLAWVIAPTRMSRLQNRVLYFGFSDDDYEGTEGQQLIGRISGAVLAVLGVAVALGITL